MWICPNGHEVDEQNEFCGHCAARRALVPRAESGGYPPPVGATIPAAALEPTDDNSARRPGNKALLLIVTGVGVAVLIIGWLVHQATSDEAQQVQGVFTLIDVGGISGESETCRDSGGYSDFGPGMDVTVRGTDGDIVGTSTTRNGSEDEIRRRLIAAGELTEDNADEFLDLGSLGFCSVLFDVEVGPSDFYEFDIGRRGHISATKEELEDSAWTVSFSLGQVDEP